jgi:hypothetical protein
MGTDALQRSHLVPGLIDPLATSHKAFAFVIGGGYASWPRSSYRGSLHTYIFLFVAIISRRKHEIHIETAFSYSWSKNRAIWLQIWIGILIFTFKSSVHAEVVQPLWCCFWVPAHATTPWFRLLMQRQRYDSEPRCRDYYYHLMFSHHISDIEILTERKKNWRKLCYFWPFGWRSR